MRKKMNKPGVMTSFTNNYNEYFITSSFSRDKVCQHSFRSAPFHSILSGVSESGQTVRSRPLFQPLLSEFIYDPYLSHTGIGSSVALLPTTPSFYFSIGVATSLRDIYTISQNTTGSCPVLTHFIDQ